VAAEAVLLSGIRSLPDSAALHLALFVFVSEVRAYADGTLARPTSAGA
jgi:hypothetical protein